MSDRHAVSVATAAQLYDVSREAIYDAVNKRVLPAKRIGNRIRIDVDALREWFDGLDDAHPESLT